MAVLGIITCEILEREFAYLLTNDPEVLGNSVLGNAWSSAIFGFFE